MRFMVLGLLVGVGNSFYVLYTNARFQVFVMTMNNWFKSVALMASAVLIGGAALASEGDPGYQMKMNIKGLKAGKSCDPSELSDGFHAICGQDPKNCSRLWAGLLLAWKRFIRKTGSSARKGVDTPQMMKQFLWLKCPEARSIHPIQATERLNLFRNRPAITSMPGVNPRTDFLTAACQAK